MSTSPISSIKKLLDQNNLDAVLISSLPNIVYLTNFYHFSEMEREAFLLITPKNNYIFTDGRYSHAVITTLKNFQLLKLSMTNPFTKLLEKVLKKERVKTLGLEENNLTVAEYKKISSVINLTKHFDLKSLRVIKDQEEIKKIQVACEIGDKAFTYIVKHIKPGITEKELAFKFEAFIRESGCIPSFPTIVAFMENAAVPHHKTSDRKLKKNELILIDSGVKYQEYCSDMTRTFFLGNATTEQKNVYQAVLEAQSLAIQQFNNELMKKTKSAKLKNLDAAARKYIISKGYPSIPHSLGHGIGLEVHEAPTLFPKSKETTKNGMVFSIEPGIYLPNKFGVRIEDLFAVVNNKLVQLTKSPSKLLEI